MTMDALVAGPDVPPFAIRRPALEDRLDEALGRRIVLVVAPAGYGKSVLLGQWSHSRPRRGVAWVSARGVGDDALQLGRRLLDGVGAAVPSLRAQLARPPGTVEQLGPAFLSHLLDELAAAPPVVIVIEDFEDVTSPTLLGEIGELLDRLPAHDRVILSSRRDPSVGLSRARLHDQVAEIRQDELAMDAGEVAALVERLAGCTLRADQARALADRTEGWAAGAQLAALALRDREDVDGYLEDFSGDDRHVADYLGDEILDGLDADERDFLLATSLLDRLHGPLCDALTGRSDGRRMLASLHERSLFLTALDDHRSWYRYHPLFRDLLRYELRTTRPEDEARLHRLAADWLLDADDPATAAGHLLAAGDWDAVVELADREGRGYVERGQSYVVLQWLEALPRSLVESSPRVALSLVLMRLTSGRAMAAEALAERTAQVHELSAEYQAIVEMTRVWLVYHHASPQAVLAAADRLLGLMTELEDEPSHVLVGLTDLESLRRVALGSAGRAELLQGHVGAAREWLTVTRTVLTHPLWLVHFTGTAAYIEALAGRLELATELATRALAAAEETGLLRRPSTADAHLALAHVCAQRGDLVEAEGHLSDAAASAESNRRHVLLAVHRVEWATWLLAGLRPDALALLAGDHRAGTPPAGAGVQARSVAVHARLLLAAGRADRAAAVLDEVEAWTVDVASAKAAVCASTGDVPGVRKVVDDWPGLDAGELTSRLHRRLWEVVVLEADAGRAEVDQAVDELIALAEPDGHLQVFRDGGREVARILRRRYLTRPSAHLRRVVEALADSPMAGHSEDLVEQLSDRELEVLRYLPSRLSNAEIAGRLFVSVNTLKTHLKAIYRKLGVTSRSEAVERAEALGLA